MGTSFENFSAKPNGSLIQEDTTSEGISLFWMAPSGGCSRVFVSAFMIVWLCGWGAGEFFAVNALWQNGIGWGNLFLLAWLCGWTFGGFVAMFVLFAMWLPSKPERITLGYDTFHHEQGSTSFSPATQHHQSENQDIASQFRKRRGAAIQLTRSEIKEFKMDRVGERQRLYYDLGVDRIEIGGILTEPDREWLYEVLERWRALK